MFIYPLPVRACTCKRLPILQRFVLLTTFVVVSQKVSAGPSADTAAPPGGVHWQSCMSSAFTGWFEAEPAPQLLCGVVEAPLIYSPDGHSGTVRLALTRLPATGVKEGSVVIVSGGPGLPGINPYLSNDSTVDRLKKSYDIIGYDPRGVGQSTPKISCKVPDNEDKAPAPGADYLAAAQALVRKTMAACIEQTGEEVLRHIGTHEAVNDLEVIRAALGEPGLTAVAYSYGTQVAALYAERFPEQTRALVLDGVVDLAENDFTQQLNQARSYQQTFQRFVAYCAKTHDCPLPNEKRAAEDFQQILRRVNDNPLITQSGDEITVDDLLIATLSMLLWPDHWPYLAALLRGADARDADEVVRLIGSDNSSDTLDALAVITCADVADPGIDIQILRRQRQAITAAAPFLNFSGMQDSLLTMCDIWPFSGSIKAHIPVPSPNLAPLLFVGQRYDATTPYVNAQKMAEWFNSPLVTREGDGHTLVLNGIDGCVDEAVVDYLLAPRENATNKVCR